MAPLILALVIGPILETSLRQAVNIAGGNLWAVIFKPISLSLYIVTALTFVLPPVMKQIKKRVR